MIEDVDGNHLVDLAAGIGVVNTGHCPTTVSSAVGHQAQELMHASFNVMPYEGYIRLAEKLNQKTPGAFAKKTFLANSGAEAVENAIKIARAFTGRQAVVCFDHAFHGRTYMAMTLTSKAKPYKQGFGPFNPEVYRMPYPYAYRWPSTSDENKVSEECFKTFEENVYAHISSTSVAAVIIEPVLGEGGFVPAPALFLKKLRDYCSQHGIVLIADEIQTAFGRTGTMFACEHSGLIPDLITTAKGLGGGMPISAVTGRAEMMDAPLEGGIGGTFGGNPVSCAAALAVFDLFEKGSILNQAKALGEKLKARLHAWKEKFQVIGDVRGLGPMLAIEVVRERTSKTPYPEAAKGLVKYCFEHGVIIMTSGTHGNVLRILAPLVIKENELDEALNVIEQGLKEIHS